MVKIGGMWSMKLYIIDIVEIGELSSSSQSSQSPVETSPSLSNDDTMLTSALHHSMLARHCTLEKECVNAKSALAAWYPGRCVVSAMYCLAAYIV